MQASKPLLTLSEDQKVVLSHSWWVAWRVGVEVPWRTRNGASTGPPADGGLLAGVKVRLDIW